MKCFIPGFAALFHTVFGQRSPASKEKVILKENDWVWRGRKQYWTGFSYSYWRKICPTALRKRTRIVRQEGSSSSRYYNSLPREYEAGILFVSFFWQHSPHWARASSFTRFLDHTQRRTTVGRTPLDEWSARRRDLYLTTHNTHNRQTPMHPVGFDPTI